MKLLFYSHFSLCGRGTAPALRPLLQPKRLNSIGVGAILCDDVGLHADHGLMQRPLCRHGRVPGGSVRVLRQDLVLARLVQRLEQVCQCGDTMSRVEGSIVGQPLLMFGQPLPMPGQSLPTQRNINLRKTTA